MRRLYPGKAVTFFSQQYPQYGWAILMAGGSLPNVTIKSKSLLAALGVMNPVDEGKGCLALGDESAGYLVYAREAEVSLPVADGRYRVYSVDTKTGEVILRQKSLSLHGSYTQSNAGNGEVTWLERL
jgi:hypothetical protein